MGHIYKPDEFCFLFLHILNGRMATLPRALPQSFRDLHFCFRESKFKTAASASFRGVDFFTIFLEVLPRSHGELPRKLFGGVAWKCAGGLSVPPRENFASAKLPRSFRKEYEHFYQTIPKPYQNHCHILFTTAQQVKKQVPPILGVNQRHNNQRHCNTFIRYL